MSDTAPDKWRCDYWRCGWVGTLDEALSAPNPFIEGDMLYACPACRDTTFVRACDIEGCNKKANAGTPVDDARRYIWVCTEHFREYFKASHTPDTPASPRDTP